MVSLHYNVGQVKWGVIVLYDESAIKQIIKEKYKSLTAFSAKIGVPRSTLGYMLNNGISSATLATVLKVCNALEISVTELSCFSTSADKIVVECTQKEFALLKKYREPEMAAAMDKIFDLAAAAPNPSTSEKESRLPPQSP